MGNEIVKYNNVMNTLQFKNFTAMDYNFLMALCSRMRDRGTEEVLFDFSEIKRLANYSSKNDTQRFIGDLNRMNKKLMNVMCSFEVGDEFHMFVLFPTFVINKSAKTLKVKVNEEYTFILNQLVGNFTRFDLIEFDNLKSKYSKVLYRLLKQFKSSGKYFVKFEDLRTLMGVPKSMSNKAVKRDILTPTLKELGSYFGNLTMIIETDDTKRGKPFKNCIFTFDSVARKAADDTEEIITDEFELNDIPKIESVSIEQLMDDDLREMADN